MTGPATVAPAPGVAEPGSVSGWAGLAAALAPVLAELGLSADIDGLGLRDELAQPATPEQRPVPSVSLRGYGHLALLGPVRRAAGARPCGQCLDRRWQVMRSRELRDALELGGATAGVSDRPSPYLTPFALSAIAGLLHGLSTREPSTPDRAEVVLLDLQTLRSRGFLLTADPECPDCADMTLDHPAPLDLAPAPKRDPHSFRLRAVDSLELDEAVLANPVCGVLGPAVVREYESPTTASTYGKMDLRTGVYLHETFWGGHTFRYRDSVSVGLLEGLERYAGMRSRAKAVGTVASLRQLRAEGRRVLDPRECGLYADGVYDDPARPVRRFAEDRAIPWVWGYSLRDREPLLLPELLTYYHSVPLAERFVQECSNGCASGSSLTEAVYFGLMELIERDAFLLTWYGGLSLPEIDGASSTSATTRSLIDRLALHGYRARFFDARITFGVPVVIAMAERVDGGRGSLCFGAGASLSGEDALQAALVEIATDAPHLAQRVTWNHDRLAPMVHDFDRVLSLHDHPLLYGLPEMREHAGFLLQPRERRSIVDTYANQSLRPSLDLRQDLDACVRMLGESGLDVIAVDQTLDLQRDLGMHTASVLVPGLLPIDFGWARQRALHAPRLRTAPRDGGFTEHPLTPDQLNRAPHPFP